MKMLSYQSTIHLPVEKIDLYQWLTHLSDNEYQGFANGHRAMGLFKDKNTEGIINVESIGGNLLVQHYTILTKDKDKVFMRSRRSDAYLFHLIRCHVWVEWKMNVVYKDEQSCVFTCEIGSDYPNQLLAIAAKLSAVNFFLQKHLDKEGENFARDIEKKFQVDSPYEDSVAFEKSIPR